MKRLFPGACAVGNCTRAYRDVLAASPGKSLFIRCSELFFYYFRQKAGVNSTMTLKISSRPRSMASVQIQVWKSVRE